MEKRKDILASAIAKQAAKALTEGNRFQVRQEHIGGEGDVRKMMNALAVSCGANIRASHSHGLLTFYSDANDDGTVVIVATVDK